MKSIFRIALLSSLAFPAIEESLGRDGSIPVSVRISYQLEMELSSGFNQYNYTVEERRMLFSAYTAGYDSNSDTLYSGGWNTMDEARPFLVPGTKYNFYVDGEDKVEDYRVSFAPIEGYRLFIDGVESYRLSGDGGGGMLSDSYEIYLEANEASMPAGTAESIESGDKIFWRVAMGDLPNGRSAGYLQIRQDSFTSAVFTPAALKYDSPHEEVHVVTSGSDLRQIKTPNALADIVTLSSTSYEIKFFESSQVGGGSPLYTTGSHTPYVKYKVEKHAGSSTKLKITKTIGSKSWQTRLEQSGSVWTLFDWYEGASHLRKKTWTVDGSGHQTIEVRNGSGTLVSRSREEYSVGGMTKEIHGYGYQNLTTTYSLLTSGSNDGKIDSITRPDGSWVKYEYYTDIDRRGLIYKIFEPYKDSPTTASSSTSGKVTYHYYESDWTGMKLLPNIVETKVNNVRTSKSTFDYSYPTITSHGKNLTLTQVTRRDYSYSGTNDYVETITKSFRQDTDKTDQFFPGKKHSVLNPDGTKISYAYLNGTLNATSKSFAPSASGTDRVEIVYTGTTDASAGDLVDDVGVIGHEYDVDDLYMVPYVSKKAEIVWDEYDEVIWEAEWLYVGGATEYVLISGDETDRDPLGNVEKITRSTSSGTSSVQSLVVYEAQFTNGLKDWEKDELGAKTEFDTYDAMGRVTKQTREGYGTISDIETHFTYDAESRIVSKRIGDTAQIETTSSYGYAGRVTEETAPGESGDIDVDYTYPSARKVKKTYPDGGYIEEEYYYDGRLKKVTGSATVPKYIDYSINSSTGVETEHVGMDLAKTIGWSKTTLDWLGRPHEEEVPTHGGNAKANYYYDSDTGLLEKKTLYSGATRLIADTLYEYDSMGRLVKEGLNVENPGTDALVDNSNDRIKEYVSDYYYDSSAQVYFSRLQTKTYPFEDSSTSLTVSDKRIQVTNLYGAGTWRLLGFSKSVDANGNVATSETEVNLTTHEVRVTTDAPDASTDAVSKSTNGFVTYTKSKEGVETTISYDKWGRKTKEEGRDDLETEYFYYSGTNLVEKTYNFYIQTGKYEYDSSGRVEMFQRQNSTGAWHEEYTSYNERGQVERKWGDAAQPVEYAYDTYGRRTTMKTYRGGSGWNGSTWPGSPGTADETTWDYHDATGLVVGKTDDAGEEVTFTYNHRGQIDLKTWARGVSIDYQYYENEGDSHISNYTGQLEKIVYSDSTPDITYTYTRHGAIDTVQDDTGTRRFSYRASDLQVEYEELDDAFYGGTSSDQARVTRTYATSGVVGRMTGLQYGKRTDSDQHYDTEYAYDPTTGRLDEITAHGEEFSYLYKSGSNLIEYVNHTAEGSGTLEYSRYTKWQTWRDLADISRNKWGSTTRAEYIYDTDWHEQLTGETRLGTMFTGTTGSTPGNSTSFGGGSYGLRTDIDYTMRGEVDYSDTFKRNSSGGVDSYLVGRREEYTYDNAINRATHKYGTAATYTYGVNALNQYTGLQRTVWSPSYDDDGNMTSDGWWNYEYDAENRIKKAQNNASWATYEYEYDYMGRMVSEKGPALVNGLRGQYWDGLNFTSYKAMQIDSKVDNSWGSGAPNPPSGMGPDTFTVRWQGYVEAPEDGVYTIYTDSDDGVQLYVDGVLVINNWTNHWPTEDSATVELKKGVKVPIMLNYYESGLDATIKLSWALAGTGGWTKKIIENQYLWTEALSGTVERRFVYHGWNVIAELDGSENLQETHVWGLDVASSIHKSAGIGGLLMTRDGSSNYFAMYDGMGNVTGMLNESGTVVAGYEYNAFGELMRAIGSRRDDHRFGYATKRTDKEKGLVNFGMRQYDTKQGRFINRDPIGERGGLNLYGFLGNDGVNNHELLGMGFFDFLKSAMKFIGSVFSKIVPQIAIATFVPGGAFLVSAHGVHEGFKRGGVIGGLAAVIGGARAGFRGGDYWNEIAEMSSRELFGEIAKAAVAYKIRHEVVKAIDRRIRGFGKWFDAASVMGLTGPFDRAAGRVSTLFVKSVGKSYERLRNSVFRSSQVPDSNELVFFQNAGARSRDLDKRWTLENAYSELESRGEFGQELAAKLRTKDISSYKAVKINYLDKETGKLVDSKWADGVLGFEVNDRLFINKALSLERAVETLIHEYSHTLGYNELQARVYATESMVKLGLNPIRSNWVDANGNVNPMTIKNAIPSSYKFKQTLGRTRGETLLQTGAP